MLYALVKFNYRKEDIGDNTNHHVLIKLAEVTSDSNILKDKGPSNDMVKNNFQSVLKDASIMQGGEIGMNHTADIGVTNLLGKVHKKKQQLHINELSDRLSPTRGLMEKIAAEHQKKQAVSVNKNRAKISKPVLEVGDVGSIKVQGNTRGAMDHPWLPIMVTVAWQVSDNTYMYTLYT